MAARTSEAVLGLDPQPAPACPLIDAVKDPINDADNWLLTHADWDNPRLVDMEKVDMADALADILDDLSELQDGTAVALWRLEEIRDRASDIRAWGQGWKDLALQLLQRHEPAIWARLADIKLDREIADV